MAWLIAASIAPSFSARNGASGPTAGVPNNCPHRPIHSHAPQNVVRLAGPNKCVIIRPALNAGRKVGTTGIEESVAVYQTEEAGRNSVLFGQLIANEPHPSKSNHVIFGIPTTPFGLVPDGDNDIDRLKHVQLLADPGAVGKPGYASHPIANRHDMI